MEKSIRSPLLATNLETTSTINQSALKDSLLAIQRITVEALISPVAEDQTMTEEEECV